jgi:hypothetical protein
MDAAATIDEELDDLEHKLTKLKVEYEQYFGGGLKREPTVLRAEIERTVQRFLSAPPTGTRYKFRFNTIVARYQAYRALWGRTLREIEAGTHRSQRFRAKEAPAEKAPRPQRKVAGAKGSEESAPSPEVRKLYEALSRAREKTGEGMGGLTAERLAQIVAKQVSELRQKDPSAKVRFRVVQEGNRAQLRASIVKPEQ